MADYIAFQEGRLEIALNGLPATVWFGLSTLSADEHSSGETLAAGNLGEIQGTGYGRLSQAKPAAVGNKIPFVNMAWFNGAASDWPNAVKSIFLATTQDNSGKAICAWNLQAGGAARDLSAPQTRQNVAPTLTLG